MSIAALISDMVKAGVDPDLIGRAAELLCKRDVVAVRDEAAERRREKDRERKRLRNSAESAESAEFQEETSPLVPPLKVSPRPPSKTPPIIPPSIPLDAGAQGEILPLEKPPDKAKGSRLPPDWQPKDADWLEFTRSEGLTDDEARRELSTFRDYWIGKPGADGRKLDWSATWRNWVRRAASARKRSAGQARPGGSQHQSGGLLAAYQRAADRFSAIDDVPRERPGSERYDRDSLALPGRSG